MSRPCNFALGPGEPQHPAFKSAVLDQTVVMLITTVHSRAGLLHAEVSIRGREGTGIIRQRPFPKGLAIGVDIHYLYVLCIAPVVENSQPQIPPGRLRLQHELLVVPGLCQRRRGDHGEPSVLAIGDLDLHIFGPAPWVLHLGGVEGQAGDRALFRHLENEDLGRQVT